jgi:uncharacterized membrane protein YfcA
MLTLAALGLFGLLIGLSLGAVGAGGSILAVPVLVYIAGQDPKVATASSLVVVGVTAAIALRPTWKLGRVRRDVAVPFGVAGIAGSFAGTWAAEGLDADALMLAFSAVMAAAAVMMARRNRAARPAPCATAPCATAPVGSPPAPGQAAHGQPTGRSGRLARIAVLGVAVGLMTGFFGVGGGFFVVPALVLALGLPMTEAVGTSLLVIAINSASAFALKAGGVPLDWAVIAVFALAAAVGALGGGSVARRFDNATLTQGFVWMVLAVAAYTAIRSGAGLLA